MPDIDLTTLTLGELKTLQMDVNKAIETQEERRKQEAWAAIEAEAQKLGFSLADLVEAAGTTGRLPRPPKYRHPTDPSLTSSGRGRQPGWFKEALRCGRSREDLLFDRE